MMWVRLRLARVARARHRAACTVAAAGGLSLSAVAHKVDDHKRHHGEQRKRNQDRCEVLRKECEHGKASFTANTGFVLMILFGCRSGGRMQLRASFLFRVGAEQHKADDP